MIAMLRAQSNARTTVDPQSCSFWLFHGDFQALTPPYLEDTFVINMPAVVAKQCSDPLVAVPTILCGKPDDCCRQRIFIIKLFRCAPLCRAMLLQNPAGSAL
jgi:hypothetical protein